VNNLVETTGINEVQKLLGELIPKEANKIMAATIFGVASQIAKDAKSRAPFKTGALKKAIKAKRAKTKDPSKPQAKVTVDRIKRIGKDGKISELPYWRFVEYGTGGGKGSHKPMLQGKDGGVITENAQPFIQPAVDSAKANMDTLIKEQFVKKVSQAAKRMRKKQGV
jgi:HK97 gp10 family phage protein